MGDWFSFEVEFPETGDKFGGKRFQTRTLLDNRNFEVFHVDVGIGDPMVDKLDNLTAPDILRFAEIEPTIVPCYPLTQQVAEKLHAYTRIHISGESSRVKDFVDMLLIAGLEEIDAAKLRRAIRTTFDERGTHELSLSLPNPPMDWVKPYAKMAADVDLVYPSLMEAFSALRKFFDPVLSWQSIKTWDPISWNWK